jgi:ubiquinone/menaquinone biosynthesis C-methylase UbiE
VPGSFEQISYAAHAREYASHVRDGELTEHARSWLRTDTIGAEIATRLRSYLLPLLSAYPGTKWLTIGDGALGSDAQFLVRHGAEALATDISTDLLVEAKRMGHIRDYAWENAEKLSCPDASFDFVLCKEAYHHFPRPYLALYESLRVARLGVALIEPLDPYVGSSVVAPLSRAVFRAIRRVMGTRTYKHTYEESGNYQYTLSLREMQKVALGMNFPAVAYRKVNTVYRWGMEYAPTGWRARHPLYLRLRAMLAAKEMLSAVGLIPYGLLVVVILKRLPTAAAIQHLRQAGFTVDLLPANPYLQSDRG